MLLDRLLELRQKRFQRFEREEDRLVQRFVQACAGEGAGFLVPLGDVELLVERNQRRRHRVDDAVEVILETGELLFDFAAHLNFQLKLAVGVAGFLGQPLRLIVSGLRVIAGAFELLFAGFDTRQHGVERFGETADFVMVAA